MIVGVCVFVNNLGSHLNTDSSLSAARLRTLDKLRKLQLVLAAFLMHVAFYDHKIHLQFDDIMQYFVSFRFDFRNERENGCFGLT